MKIEELIERIKADSGLTSPEDLALVARVAARAIELGGRAAAGEDVSEELAIVKATALNLSERAKVAISTNVLAFIQGTFTNVITKLLLA